VNKETTRILRLDIPPEQTALQLTENIPVGTYVMQVAPDGSPRFTFLSQRWLDMLDLEREAVMADPFNGFKTVHPDDYGAFIALNMEVFEKTLPFYWEGRCVVKGEIKWLIAESVPRKLPDGGTVWEGVMTDITERKRVEAQLRASEESMRKILDNAPIPMACNTLEEEPRILYLNQQFIRTFGYTLDELPTLADWARLAYPDEVYRQETFRWWSAAVGKAVDSRANVESKEFRVRCKNGDYKDVEISATILNDMLVGSLIDITERKRAEAALVRAQQDLLQQEIERTRTEARESIIRDVHDGFGSQLSSARLRAERGRLSQAEMTELLGECTADLYLVVDTLKNDQGNVGDALRFFRNRTQRRLTGTGLALQWRLELADDVSMPQQRLLSILRILQEALSNAIKHAQATHITIEALEASDQLTLRVNDDGIGLPVDIVAGKGLENMRNRAEELGGSLSLATDQHGGTSLALTVPWLAPTSSRDDAA
jgi:PAS domain S-box-containing protein